jgi:hypothetical protein
MAVAHAIQYTMHDHTGTTVWRMDGFFLRVGNAEVSSGEGSLSMGQG